MFQLLFLPGFEQEQKCIDVAVTPAYNQIPVHRPLQGDDVKMRSESNNMQFVSGMFRARAHLINVV